jgi:transposase
MRDSGWCGSSARGTGSVVTWRRAQMVLLSAQGMDAAGIAKVAFTSEDRVRDVIRNFNADGFSSLYPKYKGGHPPKFTPAQRREIKKTAKSKPAEHDLPFSTWSLAKLADFLVAEGVVDDISHEGLRVLLREEGRHLSTPENLESVQGPAVRGEEGAGRAPVCDRRPGGETRAHRSGGDLLRGSMPILELCRGWRSLTRTRLVRAGFWECPGWWRSA